MAADIQTVTVSILEREYQVNCNPDEIDALKKSAAYVDEKMRDIKTNASVLGLDRIAVMAALNIANDFIGKSQSTSTMAETQAAQIQSLSNKLDLALTRLKAQNH